MRKNKLFGKNIELSCNYCVHSQIKNDCQFCTANRVIKNGKCRKYSYNPIMRVPMRMNNLPKYDPSDFAL